MITSFVALAILFSFILPGYTFLALSGFTKGKSDFQVALQSVWASIMVHLVYTLPVFCKNALWILQANGQVQALLDNKATPFNRVPDQYIGILLPHWVGVLCLILGPFAIAGLFGFMTSYLRRRFEWDLEDRTERTIFHKVLRQFWKKGIGPLVQVTVKDGPTYWGTVVLGSYEGHKEVVLSGAYIAKGADDDPEPVEGYVYLKLDDAAHLRVWDPSSQKVIEHYVSEQANGKTKTPAETVLSPKADVAASTQTSGGSLDK